jgi:hypothetical protein
MKEEKSSEAENYTANYCVATSNHVSFSVLRCQNDGRRSGRSTLYLCKAMAVSIRSQQNQPMPSITKPNNLKKTIINVRRCEFPLQIVTGNM